MRLSPVREHCGHCRYGVVDIDIDRYAELYAGDHPAGSDEVEGDAAVGAAYAGGMEVTAFAAVGDGAYRVGRPGVQLQSLVDEQRASGAYQFGEPGEALAIGFLGAVYVEMVGIGRGDNRYRRRELVERPVVLVGLDHGVGR